MSVFADFHNFLSLAMKRWTGDSESQLPNHSRAPVRDSTTHQSCYRLISREADDLASVNLCPSGAKRCVFPPLIAFLSIRNSTQCTGQQIFPRCCLQIENSGGFSVGEEVPLPRTRIQVVHGTVPQKCARSTRPARSGILCRPAIEGLRCHPLKTSSTRAQEVTPN